LRGPSEGSVRDALSLLDQAIVQAEGEGPVTADQVRDMLGLADRTRVLDLLEATLQGRAKDALDELRHQYDSGADPQVVMRDLLDHLHNLSRIKAVGPDADLGEAADTVARLTALAKPRSLGALSRLWKLALTGLDDVRAAPDPVAAAEMAIIRLMAGAAMPSPEDAARLLAGGSQEGSSPAAPEGGAAPPAPQAHAAPAPTAEAAPPAETPPSGPADLDALIALIDEKRDIALKLDVERYVRPVSFRPGAVSFEPAEGAPANLGGRLSTFLTEATGERWLVDASAKRGGETLNERRKREHEQRMAEIMRDPAMVKALTVFPGAELLSVEEIAPAEAARSQDTGEDAGTPRQETS
jgi:DNA polymerase-3 subunit gamma/tau